MNDTPTYSVFDRFLHHIAFAGIELQKNISEIESLSVSEQLNSIEIRRPIFISSVPRAGTTLLLETVRGLGNVATNTYRDMPFILCPLTWDKLSRGFQTASQPRERAHGDGMMVGFDSAEAFEEVVWQAFWKKKYHADRIDLWSVTDDEPEFETFFRNHMKKLILLRAAKDGALPHYGSKNNANIARLPLLRRIFPDCEILIPFRNPVEQAHSLLRQHRNFLDIHTRDHFALRYMERLGHFEFGLALRPIAFPANEKLGAAPTTLEFWLEYWARAFSWVLKSADSQTILLNYDTLCEEPVHFVAALRERLGFEGSDDAVASRFRAPVSHEFTAAAVSSELMSRVGSIHGELLARAYF